MPEKKTHGLVTCHRPYGQLFAQQSICMMNLMYNFKKKKKNFVRLWLMLIKNNIFIPCRKTRASFIQTSMPVLVEAQMTGSCQKISHWTMQCKFFGTLFEYQCPMQFDVLGFWSNQVTPVSHQQFTKLFYSFGLSIFFVLVPIGTVRFSSRVQFAQLPQWLQVFLLNLIQHTSKLSLLG